MRLRRNAFYTFATLVFLLCMWVFAAFSHFCIEKPIARCTDRLLEKL